MTKSIASQLVFRAVYCTLGIVAFASSLGLFDAKFSNNFYVYYTNLSNYICLGFMFAELRSTMKYSDGKEPNRDFMPLLKFVSVIMIMITFLVYNILLAKSNSVVDYFTSLYNLSFHVILPLMFIADWFIFYEHGKIKWFYPLLSTIFPLVYVAFVMIRAAVLNWDSNQFLYPYFFLNVSEIGIKGVGIWIVILCVVFVCIGYLLLLIDWSKKLKLRKNAM